jgi:hypothetical protein
MLFEDYRYKIQDSSFRPSLKSDIVIAAPTLKLQRQREGGTTEAIC